MKYCVTKKKKDRIDIRFYGCEQSDMPTAKKYCSYVTVDEKKFLSKLRKRVKCKRTVQNMEIKNGVLRLIEVVVDEKCYREGYNITSSTFELKGFRKSDSFIKELEDICREYATVKDETRDYISRMLMGIGKFLDNAPFNKANFIMKQYLKWKTLTNLATREEAKEVVESFMTNKRRFVDSFKLAARGKVASFFDEVILPFNLGLAFFSLGGVVLLGPMCLIPLVGTLTSFGIMKFLGNKCERGKVSRIINKITSQYMDKYELAFDETSKTVKFKDTNKDRFVELLKREEKLLSKYNSLDYEDIKENLSMLLEDYYVAKEGHNRNLGPFDEHPFFARLSSIHRDVLAIKNNGILHDESTAVAVEGMDLYERDAVTDEYLGKIYEEVKMLVSVAAKGCELDLIQLRRLARKYVKSEVLYAKQMENLDRVKVLRKDLVLIENMVRCLDSSRKRHILEMKAAKAHKF